MAYPDKVPTLSSDEFEQITSEMDDSEFSEAQRERIQKHLEILQEQKE
mgnify:FL=1|jgi:hypothetical protein